MKRGEGKRETERKKERKRGEFEKTTDTKSEGEERNKTKRGKSFQSLKV